MRLTAITPLRISSGWHTLAGGSCQILKHHLVGCSQPSREKFPAQPRELADLGFMADDDSALAVGAELKVRSACTPGPSAMMAKGTRSITANYGATQSGLPWP